APGHQRLFQLLVDFLVEGVALELRHGEAGFNTRRTGAGAGLARRRALGCHRMGPDRVVTHGFSPKTVCVMSDHNNYNLGERMRTGRGRMADSALRMRR